MGQCRPTPRGEGEVSDGGESVCVQCLGDLVPEDALDSAGEPEDGSHLVAQLLAQPTTPHLTSSAAHPTLSRVP